MEGNKCGNVLWYSYWRSHPHACRQIHRKKVYLYINSRINCGNDKKNQRFYNNQLGSYNSYRNFLQPTITQSNIHTSTERIACILCWHLGACRCFTHPTAVMHLKKQKVNLK